MAGVERQPLAPGFPDYSGRNARPPGGIEHAIRRLAGEQVTGLILAIKQRMQRASGYGRDRQIDAGASRQAHFPDGDRQSAIRHIMAMLNLALLDESAHKIAIAPLYG